MRILNVKVPDPLDAALAEMASARATTRSAIVREALEAFLAGRRKPCKRTPLALARDLAGSVDGPRDLSSDPRHLASYGR